MYSNLEPGCACFVVAILLNLTTKHFRMLRGVLRFLNSNTIFKGNTAMSIKDHNIKHSYSYCIRYLHGW